MMSLPYYTWTIISIPKEVNFENLRKRKSMFLKEWRPSEVLDHFIQFVKLKCKLL